VRDSRDAQVYAQVCNESLSKKLRSSYC
jgi:hypothetical protein